MEYNVTEAFRQLGLDDRSDDPGYEYEMEYFDSLMDDEQEVVCIYPSVGA